MARKLQPDVAMMDIAMPRLNGLEATRRITAECPRCRVLALTAHEEERYIIQLPQVEAAADAAALLARLTSPILPFTSRRR